MNSSASPAGDREQEPNLTHPAITRLVEASKEAHRAERAQYQKMLTAAPPLNNNESAEFLRLSRRATRLDRARIASIRRYVGC